MEDESLVVKAQHVKELTLRSLRRTLNQLKEEIARFESRASSTPGQG